MPAPWRPMTTPSKTWILSLSPSTTFACTLMVSPGRKLGIEAFIWGFSIAFRIVLLMLTSRILNAEFGFRNSEQLSALRIPHSALDLLWNVQFLLQFFKYRA